MIVKESLNPAFLRPGDEFWGDSPYKHERKAADGFHDVEGYFAQFIVSGMPYVSTNPALFPDDNTCVVVPVEYADGSRGSRLYSQDTIITVRRDNE